MIVTLAFLCTILVGTPLGPNETLQDIWAMCSTPVIEVIAEGIEGDAR